MEFFIKYKPIVEFFAGIASILGIIYPLTMWIIEKKSPLKLKEIIIYKNTINNNFSYSFIVNNSKNYPVTIDNIAIYSNRFYLITRSNNHSINFSGPGFSDNDKIIESNNEITISSRGSLHLTIPRGNIATSKVLFVRFKTSNGFQTIKCNKIIHEKIGDVEIFDGMYDIANYFKAKIIYFGLKFPISITQIKAKELAEKWKI